MNNQELSDSFDTLLSSYSTQAQFGHEASRQEITLDEFEKSVLLSQAQDIIVKSYFNSKTNAVGEGFDDSARRQVDFSSLITVKNLEVAEDQTSVFDDRGIIYNMPTRIAAIKEAGVFDGTFDMSFNPTADEDITTDVLFILNEKLVTQQGNHTRNYVVVPINHKEYDRAMSKVYAQPLKKQAWRLIQNSGQGFDFKTELIPRWNLAKKETILYYKIRYVRRPYPIILVDLPDGLNIDGFNKSRPCELNPILHHDILQKAVEIAVATRGGTVRQQQQ